MGMTFQNAHDDRDDGDDCDTKSIINIIKRLYHFWSPSCRLHRYWL